MNRYKELFSNLKAKGEGAFIPFLMLSDPDREGALELVDRAVAAGADALELGIGFSDPVADGPVIQRAHLRALQSGALEGGVLTSALEQISTIRKKYPQLPIGLLTYANLVFATGVRQFFTRVGEAGADSVLIADCPLREGDDVIEVAREAGVAPIFIASPDSSTEFLAELARLEDGYIYLVSRPGVTGGSVPAQSGSSGLERVIRTLKELGSPPVLQGFGISTPAQVKAALDAGADGVFCGSALVKLINEASDSLPDGGFGFRQSPAEFTAVAEELASRVAELKAATKPGFTREG